MIYSATLFLLGFSGEEISMLTLDSIFASILLTLAFVIFSSASLFLSLSERGEDV